MEDSANAFQYIDISFEMLDHKALEDLMICIIN